MKPVGLHGKLILAPDEKFPAWQPEMLMLRKRKGCGNIAFGQHDSARKYKKHANAKKEITIYLADPALVLTDCLS